MKPSEIKVGKTYINRGAGRTRRRVLGIGDEHKPLDGKDWRRPKDTGVLYEQEGKQRSLYLISFARWAGEEVRS